MRQTGTVKFFLVGKGYGFIKPDGGGKDVFVHVSAVQRAGLDEIRKGSRLSFTTQRDKKKGKGPKAIRLSQLSM